jgi:RimJ/RimL family protein N-acetyltransferase
VLHAERLMLREVEDDWRSLHVMHADPEVTRFWEKPRSTEQTREWLSAAIHANQDSPRHSYDFAIICTSNKALIGQIGIGAAECRYHGSLNFGYAVARQYWGNGYMTEALKMLLRFGFTELGAHRICAECDPANQASARVMEKVGMTAGPISGKSGPIPALTGLA